MCECEGIASREQGRTTQLQNEERQEVPQWESRTYLYSNRGFGAEQDSSQGSSVPDAVPRLFHHARE